MKRILLTGGSGTLGKELQKLNDSEKVKLYCPSSFELNLKDCDLLEKTRRFIRVYDIDMIVHAAAFTNVKLAETNQEEAIDVNVLGTAALLLAAQQEDKKFVYISTDHVFDGKDGHYTKDSPINPVSVYAKTKASAELLVRTYSNSLVIRTSFFGYTFPFPIAYVDQFSSKDYVDIIAPKVYDTIVSDSTGIVHVGSKRRSMYQIALERSSNVQPEGMISGLWDTSLE